MAVSGSGRRPVAHVPLILGMLRKLNVASIIDTLLPPHPANVLSCGRGGRSFAPGDPGGTSRPLQSWSTVRGARHVTPPAGREGKALKKTGTDQHGMKVSSNGEELLSL